METASEYYVCFVVVIHGMYNPRLLLTGASERWVCWLTLWSKSSDDRRWWASVDQEFYPQQWGKCSWEEILLTIRHFECLSHFFLVLSTALSGDLLFNNVLNTRFCNCLITIIFPLFLPTVPPPHWNDTSSRHSQISSFDDGVWKHIKIHHRCQRKTTQNFDLRLIFQII